MEITTQDSIIDLFIEYLDTTSSTKTNKQEENKQDFKEKKLQRAFKTTQVIDDPTTESDDLLNLNDLDDLLESDFISDNEPIIASEKTKTNQSLVDEVLNNINAKNVRGKHCEQMTIIERRYLYEKLYIRSKDFTYCKHAEERLIERKILKRDVVAAIKNPQIIDFSIAGNNNEIMTIKSCKRKTGKQSVVYVVFCLTTKEVITVYVNESAKSNPNKYKNTKKYNKNFNIPIPKKKLDKLLFLFGAK